MFKILIDTTHRFNKSVTLIEFGDGGDDSSEGADRADLKEKTIDSMAGDLDIVPTIAEILAKHNLKPQNINEYLVNKGPGSFTGLKIGVTIANTLNWVLEKKTLDELVLPEYGGEPNIHKKQ